MMKFSDFQQDFCFGITDLKLFYNCPYLMRACSVLYCTGGKATISVGVQEFSFVKNGEMIILPGSTLSTISHTSDFLCRIFIFSEELYNELSYQLGVNFSEYLFATPFYIHKENSIKLKYFSGLMKTAKVLHLRRNIYFRKEMYRNFVQCYLIYLYNSIQDHLKENREKYTHKDILFHRFLSLLDTHYKEHKDVIFYADKLNITDRYLWIIANHATGSESPKDIIDKKLILEIKILLRSTHLTIQEISQELSFTNQSYFGRYFKHHVGLSPSQYRKNEFLRLPDSSISF